MHILVVAPWIPYPFRTGGKYRVANILLELSKLSDAEVSLLAPAHHSDCAGIEFFQRSGIEVHTAPGRHKRRSTWELAHGVFSSSPSSMVEGHQSLQSALRQLTEKETYDVLQFEFLAMAHTVGAATFAGPTYLTAHFPATETYRRSLSIVQKRSLMFPAIALDTIKLPRYEKRQYQRFSGVFVTSEADLEMMPATGAHYIVAPNGVDLNYFKRGSPRISSSTIVSTCNFQNPANLDGVRYFASQIWPRVLNAVPDATYLVIGPHLPESIRSKLGAQSGIRVVGEVEDVRPYFEHAAASVVFMRAGGGTKLRLLTSLAMETPVVATSLGAEGLDLHGLAGAVVTDNDEEIASALIRYLDDRTECGGELRKRVQSRYSWQRTAATMRASYVASLA